MYNSAVLFPLSFLECSFYFLFPYINLPISARVTSATTKVFDARALPINDIGEKGAKIGHRIRLRPPWINLGTDMGMDLSMTTIFESPSWSCRVKGQNGLNNFTHLSMHLYHPSHGHAFCQWPLWVMVIGDNLINVGPWAHWQGTHSVLLGMVAPTRATCRYLTFGLSTLFYLSASRLSVVKVSCKRFCAALCVTVHLQWQKDLTSKIQTIQIKLIF